VLNATTLDSIAAWPSGLFPNRLHLTLDGKLVLQSNAQSSTVSVYDARTRALIGNIDFAYDESRAKPTMLTQFGRSATPLGILIAPDGKRAWVALAAMDEKSCDCQGRARAGRDGVRAVSDRAPRQLRVW
jgi:DNA-binding beta-propeller fold protein YncE